MYDTILVPARNCRFMQTFVVFIFVVCLLIFGVLSYIICVLMLLFGNTYLKVIVTLYAIWIYIDRDRAQNSARGLGLKYMRSGFVWQCFREYFPIELVKTAELPSNHNYILACFPHGILSLGLFINMCADIRKWNELFPNIRVHLATLAVHFNTPIWRHIIQYWAMVSVTKKSLLNNLKHSHHDHRSTSETASCAIGLIVGGSQEALDAKPGQYILTIKKRSGFVKLAMETGSSIVPVISFGEVDIYDQVNYPPNSFLRAFQLCIKRITGVSPILFKGTGFLRLLPHRRRIVQVVGAPIYVEQCDNPREEEVNKLHTHFMECLNNLFETHKAKYIENPEKVKLIMK